jgi:SWI/SNF-related matrix-associated actin-dependent regulator 1 of chromatin subfamily A
VSLTPRPYQLAGRDFLAGRTRALLADEMRVGKTPQAILACDAISARRILVTCPAIATEHWKREFAKWSPDRPPAHILDRHGPPPAGWEGVLVGSYNQMVTHNQGLAAARWDVFIPDEAHFAGNPTAKRTHMVYGRTGLGWHADRIWALSGTPAPTHAGQLYPLLKAFGAVKCTYDEFVKNYCAVNARGLPSGTKKGAAPELNAIAAKVMLRRMRRDVAPEMPAIDFQFLEIGRTTEDDLSSVDPEAALSEIRIAVAMAKVRALVENIRFALDNGLLRQTVVFGYHREPLAAVHAALMRAGYRVALITGDTPQTQRTMIQDHFLAGLLDVVVGQLIACGTAIDLSAASHAYLLELDFVPGNNTQAANRLVSMQRGMPVTIDVATCPGTFDDKLQRILIRRVQELSMLY